MSHDVFISYSHKDKHVADAMCFAFEESGVRCWYAPRDIAPGTTWAAGIEAAISKSRILVLIFTEDSNMSDQVAREIDRAVSNGVTIIPFKLTDSPPQDAFAYYLATVHWLDAMTRPLENSIDDLVQMVAGILAIPAPSSVTGKLHSRYGDRLKYKSGGGKGLSGVRLWALVGGVCAAAVVIVMLVQSFSLRYTGDSGAGGVPAQGTAGNSDVTDRSAIAEDNPMKDLLKKEKLTYGNTAANLINDGFVVQSGEYVYFHDEERFGSISRFPADLAPGGQLVVEALLDASQYAQSLNNFGSTLFYVSPIDAAHTTYMFYTYNLNQMQGTGVGNNIFFNFTAVDDYIIYIDKMTGNICFSLRNNSEKRQIFDSKYGVERFGVNGQWIYYLERDTAEGDQYSLRRMKLDGSENALLKENVQDFQVTAKALYYRIRGGDEIFAAQPDGSDEQRVVTGAEGSFYAEDDVIYYNSEGKLFAADAGGGAQRELYARQFNRINGIGDYLYGFNSDETMIRIAKDGTGGMEIGYGAGSLW